MSSLKHATVIAISLVAFVIPNAVGFGVWILGDGLPDIPRSLAAILGWVVSFAVSSMLFWRIILTAFRTGPE